MKLSKITIGATIATGQYQNISPVFEVTDITNEKEALDYGMKFIKELYARFSATGELKERVVKNSTDKINDLLG